MLARTHRALSAAVLAMVGAIACAPASSSSLREPLYTSPIPPLTPTSRVIDAARIARSGSQSALDAIRALVPNHRLSDAGPLSAPWVSSTSMSRGTLRVIVDRHPVADIESLRMIPAGDLIAIHVLSGADATIRYGPNYGGGVIVLQTRGGLSPLD
jgi:hypothetical protein